MNEKDLDKFTELMSKPGPGEEEFFARRRALGLGVGLNKKGELVKQRAENERESGDEH